MGESMSKAKIVMDVLKEPTNEGLVPTRKVLLFSPNGRIVWYINADPDIVKKLVNELSKVYNDPEELYKATIQRLKKMRVPMKWTYNLKYFPKRRTPKIRR